MPSTPTRAPARDKPPRADKAAASTTPRRRARLSRERILEAACAMLGDTPGEGFTLEKLARRLGAGVMSLYTYFPSRDALLDAVAEHLFRQLPALDPAAQPWQAALLQRLWATHRLMEQHAALLGLIFRDGRHSAFWIRDWWLPIAQLLLAQGADTQRTAFAMHWLGNSAMGMMAAQVDFPRRRQSIGLEFLDGVPPEQQATAASLWLSMREVQHDAVLDFGFQQLIHGLETLLDQA